MSTEERRAVGGERGSGRTQRMLEAVEADPSPLVVVVAYSIWYGRELAFRFRDTFGGELRQRNELHRGDGRRVLFVGPDADQLRGNHVPMYVDHYTWEAPRAMTYELAAVIARNRPASRQEARP